MAALDHVYAESSTLYNADPGDTTWVDIHTVSGGSLTASTKYLLIASAYLGGAGTGAHFDIRVTTDDDATIASKSASTYEPGKTASTDLKAWFFVHSFTTDGTPADVKIQMQRSSGSGNIHCDTPTLMLINLTALGAEGWAYYEHILAAGGSSITGTPADLVTIDGGDLGTDEYVIMGYLRADGVGDTNGDWTVEFHGADAGASLTMQMDNQEESEDLNETRIVGGMWYHQSTDGSLGPKITSSVSGTAFTEQGGYMIAFPTSWFEDFYRDWAAGPTGGSGERTVHSRTFTPTTDGNHLLWGALEGQNGPDGFLHFEDGTTEIRTGLSGHSQRWEWSSGDHEQIHALQRYSITGSTTINLKCSFGTANMRDQTMMIMSLEQGDGPTPVSGISAQHKVAGPGRLLRSGA